MGLSQVERWLAAHIGLDPSSIGPDEVARAVRRRMDDIGLDDVGAYVVRLASDATEQEKLVESVLVPETWFFREPAGLTALAEQARRHVQSGAGRRFRVLSCPCATGEEAYSMAITLVEEGIEPDRARVDGVDVSRRAIASARLGVYGERALRHVTGGLAARYFEPAPGGQRVKEHVREMVGFSTGNLVAPHGLSVEGPYDMVFCRNVLIYFDEPARQRALSTIDGLLGDAGMLVTGHAEAARMVAPRFVSARIPRAFAYVKAPPPEPPSVMPTSPSTRSVAATDPRPVRHRRRATLDRGAGPLRRVWSDAAKGTADVPTVDRARQLADEGRLDDARAECRAILAVTPGSAEGYYLLGLIESAAGRAADAEVALRRALYLAPRHQDALRLLALKLERRGERGEAARLRRRAAGESGRTGDKGNREA